MNAEIGRGAHYRMTSADQPLALRTSSPVDEADRAALARIADGELAALEDLYDRYKTMAYSIAYRITNDATLAEDVVQDAFLGAWRNAARYVAGRGSVKTWLLAIVITGNDRAVRRRRPGLGLPELDGGHCPPHSNLPDVWREVSANLDPEPVREALVALTDVQLKRSNSPTSAASPSRRSPNEPERRSARSRAGCALACWRCDWSSLEPWERTMTHSGARSARVDV